MTDLKFCKLIFWGFSGFEFRIHILRIKKNGHKLRFSDSRTLSENKFFKNNILYMILKILCMYVYLLISLRVTRLPFRLYILSSISYLYPHVFTISFPFYTFCNKNTIILYIKIIYSKIFGNGTLNNVSLPLFISSMDVFFY